MTFTVRHLALSVQCRLNDAADSLQLKYKRRQETRKFTDKNRRAIYERITLTAAQEKEIDDLYIGNYGEKIPYTWHRHYTAYTGRFDVRYFPELLYIPEFERFCNLYPEFVIAVSDKNHLPCIAKMARVKMPQTLFSSTRGFIKDCDNRSATSEQMLEWFSKAGEVFAKPSIHTGSGVGCMLLQMECGRDQITGEKAEDILKTLGKDYVIQKRVICSEEIQKLHPDSCNTFRIITYRWKNAIRRMPVIMRIGTNKNHIDNAHAGGIFIGVNGDGTLKKTAFTEFNNQFAAHPDTGIVFENYLIHHFQDVVDAAIKMHSMLPQLGVVNWDFTIDNKDEPVLLEANTRGGGIWVIEMAHGTGPFGDDTDEVLRWMRLMKSRRASQREEIAFGNI